METIIKDIINEYAYDLDRYDTYEELVSALRGDDRLKYDKDNSYYLDLATQVISKGEGIVCDRCSNIIPCDEAFCADYADTDETIMVVKEMNKEDDMMSIICQDCYKELKTKGE